MLQPWAQAQNWQNVVPTIPNSFSTQPPPKRALVACRRCRRLRSKCVHENSTPPCRTCVTAGPAEAAQCVFAARGRQGNDREFRRRRPNPTDQRSEEPVANTLVLHRNPPEEPLHTHGIRTESIQANAISISAAPTNQLIPKDPWDLLPPYEELVEGCKVFGTSCLQLGFIPKALFLESLATDRRSISVFLLLSMLSISARFTPFLIRRYGADGKAGEHFMKCAADMVQDEMYEPTLERTQAFFLLGIAEWGKGNKNRSSMLMGLAVRMAGVLRLHREETYQLPLDATADDVVSAEAARRTFWSIECHDNLYTGHQAPVSFSRTDISALLPCEENEFAFGRISHQRAALSGTQAAHDSPELVSMPSRSLFATLIQAHDLWGQVARRASRSEREREPWLESSEYIRLTSIIKKWEDNMPDRHRWSLWNFRGYKSDRVHMAYLSIVTITRLNNIVIRRIYLEEIMKHALNQSDVNQKAPSSFWQSVSFELFSNVQSLYEPIDTFFFLRSPEDGFPAMFVFCVYICGSCASYLWKWPQLCPALSTEAEKIVLRSLEVLRNLQHAWPMAVKWLAALQKVSASHHSKKNRPLKAMVSQERFLSVTDGLLRNQIVPEAEAEDSEAEEIDPLPQGQQESHDIDNLGILSSAAALATQQRDGGHSINTFTDGSNMFLSPVESFSGIHSDNFDTELYDFLQENVHLGMMEAW